MSEWGSSRTYKVPAVCTNCGYKGFIEVEKGKRRPDKADCPKCECCTYVRPIDK